MQGSSTYKLLYLLNILSCDDLSKKEIIEDFRKNGYKITESSITQYIKQLQKHNVNVQIKNDHSKNIYHIEKEKSELKFSEKELRVLTNIKKLLILEKNYKNIRKAMRLFYQLALFIKDMDERREFIDFGYYSTINWYLVAQLEKHCREKNVLILDYILPRGENKYITMHADSLKVGEFNDRIYLHGVLENCTQFSRLPIDRIFMIKKVKFKNKPIEATRTTIKYVITKELYEQIKLDDKEKVIKIEDDRITIERPDDDFFYIVQRLFNFCPDLLYVSSGEIKKQFVEKLNILRGSYEIELDY